MIKYDYPLENSEIDLFAKKKIQIQDKKQLFLQETISGVLYSKNYKPEEKINKITLPNQKKNRSKTLFLDLDETLVHCCNPKKGQYLVSFDEENLIGLNIRPYYKKFLSKISKIYEIFIFSAGESKYVETIVNYLDPKSKYITGVIDRNGCVETKEGIFVKDLNRVRNRNIKDIILVDNTTFSFGTAIDNGIPIFPFTDNKEDKELALLINYLIEASKYEDIRDFNRKMFNLSAISNYE